MKVYLAICSDDYEGDEVISAHYSYDGADVAARAKAHACAKTMGRDPATMLQEDGSYQGYGLTWRVKEMEVL